LPNIRGLRGEVEGIAKVTFRLTSIPRRGSKTTKKDKGGSRGPYGVRKKKRTRCNLPDGQTNESSKGGRKDPRSGPMEKLLEGTAGGSSRKKTDGGMMGIRREPKRGTGKKVPGT